MKLSLQEAAALIGKTPRQIRYLIKTGKVSAQKKKGRWVIESTSLPLSEGQSKAAAARGEKVREIVEEVIGPTVKAGQSAKHFSVRDLRAFQRAEPIYRELVSKYGPEEPAAHPDHSV